MVFFSKSWPMNSVPFYSKININLNLIFYSLKLISNWYFIALFLWKLGFSMNSFTFCIMFLLQLISIHLLNLLNLSYDYYFTNWKLDSFTFNSKIDINLKFNVFTLISFKLIFNRIIPLKIGFSNGFVYFLLENWHQLEI